MNDKSANPWDQRYAGDDFVYGTEPNDFLGENAHRILPGRVLCLGEGEGRNAVFLAGLGHRVTAVDGSKTGLEKAKRLAASRGVDIETVHVELADFAIVPDAWDAIVSIFCHLPTALRARVHSAAVHGLKKGGVFLLEGYAPDQLEFGTGGPPVLDLLMNLDDLRGELDGLRLDHACEVVRDVREGRLHTGRGAVVQIIGVKP